MKVLTVLQLIKEYDFIVALVIIKIGKFVQHCRTNNGQANNSLPNNKILDWSKVKAFVDDKLNVINKLKFVLGWVENIVGKGENSGFQRFLTMFSQAFFLGSLKVGIVW